MRREAIGAIAIAAWLTSLPLAQGCKEEEADAEPAKANADGAAVPGSDLVRGVVGAARPGDTTGGDPTLRDAANAVAAEIEAETPGRLAQLEVELHSRDGERVIAAKLLLDQSIAAAVASKTFAGRVGASPGGSLVARSLRPLDESTTGSGAGGGSSGSGTPLVDAGQQLLCEQPKGPDGMPMHLGQVNGRYGDDATGASGAARDTADLVDTTDLLVTRTLDRVDSGALTPDPESRLGAYAATSGYPAGTVGNAVHNAIGTIYVTFANYGQEKIGRVFNSPEAKALYNQPVASCAGMQMAMLEHQYWQDVTSEDGWSPGGRMGSMFNPTVRNFLQTKVFAGSP